MTRTLTLLSLLFLVGCHAKFKREAPTLGEVRTQVLTTGGPYVQLGHVDAHTDNAIVALAAVAVNVAQEVQGVKLTDRIAKAVHIEDVNRGLEQGIAETLDQGPPFAWVDRKDANATLQIEVLSYGLTVPYLGAPGLFTYDMRARIYKKDGDRVYTTHHTCTIGAGSPGVAESVLGVVNNVRELQEMSDEQINEAFAIMAEACARSFVVKMRQHAG